MNLPNRPAWSRDDDREFRELADAHRLAESLIPTIAAHLGVDPESLSVASVEIVRAPRPRRPWWAALLPVVNGVVAALAVLGVIVLAALLTGGAP